MKPVADFGIKHSAKVDVLVHDTSC